MLFSHASIEPVLPPGPAYGLPSIFGLPLNSASSLARRALVRTDVGRLWLARNCSFKTLLECRKGRARRVLQVLTCRWSDPGDRPRSKAPVLGAHFLVKTTE
jgi:hypothetical protein